jgi:hypothetical protein
VPSAAVVVPLLLGMLLGGLRRGVSNDSRGLGRPLTSNMVRVDVRCHANKMRHLTNVKSSNNKNRMKRKSEIEQLTDRSACASL